MDFKLYFKYICDSDNDISLGCCEKILKLNSDNDITIRTQNNGTKIISTNCANNAILFDENNCFANIASLYTEAVTGKKCKIIYWSVSTDY